MVHSYFKNLVRLTLILGFVVVVIISGSTGQNESEKVSQGTSELDQILEPTVLISILVRNKVHTLPYFLTLLEGLDYPKDRISLWIQSDHNEDESAVLLRNWIREVDARGSYHSVSAEIIDSPPFRQSDQIKGPTEWTDERFRHLIKLKERALRIARKIWADYIWYLDADVLLANNQTLKLLVQKNLDLVAPMLESGGMYSNFWGSMLENYYYNRSEDYKEMVDRKKTGCFAVPMIHSAVLMNLGKRVVPDFKKVKVDVPEDDIILFATNAKSKGYQMHVCNDHSYGYIISPLDETEELTVDSQQLRNVLIEMSTYWPDPPLKLKKFEKWLLKDEEPTSFGFSKVFLINLKRRPDRLDKMQKVLGLLGVEYEILEASDGSQLTEEKLFEMGIKQLPEYRDPYSQRIMTLGEIGCFLSHYRIWKKMADERIHTALVLEDDIRFEPFFRMLVERLFQEAANVGLDWDLMYLGRKRSAGAHEPYVAGTKHIVHVGYSYWTLGYALTFRGAKKLLAPEPLKRLVPVDEYLPIMFDRHSNEEWKSAFPVRNVRAFSAEPLLMYPSHYTGEPGYISDTEASQIIPVTICNSTANKDEL